MGVWGSMALLRWLDDQTLWLLKRSLRTPYHPLGYHHHITWWTGLCSDWANSIPNL